MSIYLYNFLKIVSMLQSVKPDIGEYLNNTDEGNGVYYVKLSNDITEQ